MYSWNTTIDDTSSIILFSPYSEGPIENGWAGWFQNSATQFASSGGEEGVGESLHITQFPGASLHLQFEGTAVYLYGTANCTYSITLDSQSVSVPLSLPFGLLFYQEGLTSTTHFVQLTAHPSANTTQQVAFDRATFTNTIDQNANGLVPVVYENWNSTLQYNGSWTTPPLVDWIPNTSNPQPYKETNLSLSSVSLQFTGGVAVAINAPRNWGHWTYNVSLDGEVSSWNSSTLWGIGDAVLFYQNGLDPTQEHQIALLNTGTQTYYKLSLNYLTVWALNGSDLNVTPSSSSTIHPAPTQVADSTTTRSTNVGVIVGPVVAGVAVLALLIVGVLWLKKRRYMAPLREEQVAPFPRNDHPPVWAKGQEAGILPMTQVYEAVVPTAGSKRAGIAAGPAGASGSSSTSTPPPPAVPSSNPIPARSANGHLHQPSTVGTQSINPSSSVDPPSSGPPVDVNQIIELIAQRIDPRTNVPEGDAPPRYNPY